MPSPFRTPPRRSRLLAAFALLVMAGAATVWLLQPSDRPRAASSDEAHAVDSQTSAPDAVVPAFVDAAPLRAVEPSANEAPVETAMLSFAITDAEDDRSVSPCQVVTAGEASACDHAGRVRFAAVPVGRAPVAVSAPGYAPRELWVVVAAGRPQSVEVRLTRGVRLEGRVVTPDGLPMPGARVATIHYALGQDVPESATATDEAGRFELESVAPGRLALVASAPGYADTLSPEQRLAAGSVREGIELVLSAGGAIGGALRTLTLEAVEGARVEAVRIDRDAPAPAPTSTLFDGGFHIDSLSPGEYRVSASHGRMRAVANGVRVLPDQETTIALVLREGDESLSGRVLSRDGRPAVDVAIEVSSSQGLVNATARTDADGRFALDGLSGAPYRVAAPGVEQRGIPAGAHVELVLPGRGRLEGVVTDEQGRGLNDFSLTLIPLSAPPGGLAPRYRREHVLSADGTFGFDDLPEGAYAVRAESPVLVTAEAGARVTAGDSTRVTIVLRGGATVSGRLLSGNTPAAGCEVGTVNARASTDPQGEFRLRGIAPGRSFVWASCPDGSRGGQHIEAQAGSERRIEIRLRPVREAGNDGGGDFAGIGAGLRTRADGQVVVAFVQEGGPAFLAGVAPDDEVLEVDGWSTEGVRVSDVINRIRGAPGTPVMLDLRRPSSGARFFTAAERTRIAFD